VFCRRALRFVVEEKLQMGFEGGQFRNLGPNLV
jgi:hypothetical protein